MQRTFQRFSEWCSWATGTPWAFVGALGTVIVWAILGPVFHFSDSWQLYANTGTTLITFLMLFVVQNTQNRASAAMHAKLDELLLSSQARNELVNVEAMSEQEIAAWKADIAHKAASRSHVKSNETV